MSNACEKLYVTGEHVFTENSELIAVFFSYLCRRQIWLDAIMASEVCYLDAWSHTYEYIASLIARFMGPTWGPSGANRTQVGPMLAPWTLLSGLMIASTITLCQAYSAAVTEWWCYHYVMCQMGSKALTHWGRVTLICVSKQTIIGSDNGLSPGRHQAIIWTNAGILLTGSLWTKFSEIIIDIYTFSF